MLFIYEISLTLYELRISLTLEIELHSQAGKKIIKCSAVIKMGYCIIGSIMSYAALYYLLSDMFISGPKQISKEFGAHFGGQLIVTAHSKHMIPIEFVPLITLVLLYFIAFRFVEFSYVASWHRWKCIEKMDE